ncbi:MAG: TonB-dependent receptor [Bacteroidetes bacterium]|uniref:TonB-dependent receptor n=1 Tax=Candidatus Cryptobacteroides avicola TaxID=2840757 RepID=A0A940II95_9BACT|nr:TonB-dependent receptor [Candidatus Cryptobacteroides avicola]
MDWKNKYLVFILCFISSVCILKAQETGYYIEGQVTDSKTGEAIYGAAVNIKDSGIWTMTDDKGIFSFSNLHGSGTITVSCLGYVDISVPFTQESASSIIEISMDLNTLALDEVTVTAQRKKDGLNTSLSFGTTALEHLQMSNITDVSALLPGGKTVNPDLTVNNTLSLRDGGSSAGNAAFGTALEVDGVRLGNNASFGELSGSGTRSISTENIESIEVITGVPSAEYGDLNSGMVRIHTKKGRTPLSVTMAVNPRTWQASVSKGIDLQKERGFLNISGEWVQATQKLASPYTSYTRRGFSVAYSNTFMKVLKFEAGFTGNIGGMNSKNDPDAYTGAYERIRDNVFRGNVSMTWLLDKKWITNLKFDASVNLNDNLSHEHTFNSSASEQPSVHALEQGYFLAGSLPLSYFSDRIVDSKELDYAASVKYGWIRKAGNIRSALKAGVQWKANGNAGRGEYYQDPSLAASGYRPRPYNEYPYMHNVAAYIEENITVPVWDGSTLQISAGIRMENLFVKGTRYKDVHSFSPRLNARWDISDAFAIRGGWGISEKLPSFYILYPEQEYRDILSFSASHGDNTSYVYYTQPYTLQYNPQLRWQRNSNAELGIETYFLGTSVSLTGYYGKTSDPYKFSNSYTPFSYNTYKLPDGFQMPADPQIKVDSQSGQVSIIDGQGNEVPMDLSVTDRSFFESEMADNGADIHRAGAELIIDFPEIRPVRTSFRVDANYAYTYYIDNTLSWYYRTGWSHTSIKNRSYQYVGLYANGGNTSSTSNGKVTHSIDANITAITHIPQARIIITCRLEMSLLKMSRNLSMYKGKEYAYNVSEEGYTASGGSIYDGSSFTAVRPVAYMDLNGEIHEFTDANARNPEFSNLIIKSGNAYTFAQDGYSPYFSANISITKEIGDHVSVSFFANNFTNSRKYVVSKATGISAIFTPAFYYGLTCKLKF